MRLIQTGTHTLRQHTLLGAAAAVRGTTSRTACHGRAKTQPYPISKGTGEFGDRPPPGRRSLKLGPKPKPGRRSLKLGPKPKPNPKPKSGRRFLQLGPRERSIFSACDRPLKDFLIPSLSVSCMRQQHDTTPSVQRCAHTFFCNRANPRLRLSLS